MTKTACVVFLHFAPCQAEPIVSKDSKLYASFNFPMSRNEDFACVEILLMVRTAELAIKESRADCHL